MNGIDGISKKKFKSNNKHVCRTYYKHLYQTIKKNSRCELIHVRKKDYNINVRGTLFFGRL